MIRRARVRVAWPLALGLAAGLAAEPGAAAQANAAGPGGQAALALGRELGRVEEPVLIGNAGDGSGRIFVGERRGRLVVFGGDAPGPAPFLDISSRVSRKKGGLRGVAFPFDFVDRRWFAAAYVDGSGALTVSRFRLGPDGAADAASEQPMLRVPLPGTERPGGGLAFGPDGMLYLGVGEGRPARKSIGDAQSPGSLLGKLLRIDASGAPAGAVGGGGTSYSVPRDNPWVTTPGARPEAWAMGLGNPVWIGLDPESGDFHLLDTAGDRIEELNVLPGTAPGGWNFGWNLAEGSDCRTATNCPANLAGAAMSVRLHRGDELVGGALARNPAHAPMDGRTFFAERRSGRIWALARSGEGAWEGRMLLDTTLRIGAVGAAEDGSLLVADERSGRIHELRDASPAPRR